jgi:hypothetical protein
MHIVATYPYRHQAEIAAGFLQDAGIAAAVIIDDAGGSQVGMAFVNQARVGVRDDLAERAAEVLRAAKMLGADE